MKKLLLTLALPLGLMAGCAQQQSNYSEAPSNSPATTVTKTAPTTSYAKIIYLPSSRYPETAKHIEAAEKAGKSKVCTLDRKDVTEHRKESLAGVPTKPGYDRDEFPMAFCKEGGYNANIMYISPSDNRGAGSWISHQVSGLPDGTKIEILVK
jgi:hypothetical protein